MIYNIGNKIKNRLLQEYSLKNTENRSFGSQLFRQKSYETETVTTGLCYIEDLISLKNDIV